jgi:hypothetical protein
MYGFQIIIIEVGGVNNLRRWIPSSGHWTNTFFKPWILETIIHQNGNEKNDTNQHQIYRNQST